MAVATQNMLILLLNVIFFINENIAYVAVFVNHRWFCISVSVVTRATLHLYFQISAMFVCIVMDYYPKGDLGHLLRMAREKGTTISEEVGQRGHIRGVW